MVVKRIIIFVLLLLFQGIFARFIQQPQKNTGESADPFKFKSQVRVLLNDDQNSECVGVVIGEKFVLTTASCLYKSGKVRRTNVSETLSNNGYNLVEAIIVDDEEDGPYIQYEVLKIIVHKDYRHGRDLADNLAILQVHTKRPMILGYQGTIYGNDKDFVISPFRSQTSTSLYWPSKIEVSEVDIETCQDQYRNETTMDNTFGVRDKRVQETKYICARSINETIKFSSMDLGVPLIKNGTVYGLMSSFGCTNPDILCDSKLKLPQIYTRLSSYTEWILSSIEIFQKEEKILKLNSFNSRQVFV